jgi:hypothetical protein
MLQSGAGTLGGKIIPLQFYFFLSDPPYILPIKNRKGISLPRDKKAAPLLTLAITFPHQIHCDVLDAINYPM